MLVKMLKIKKYISMSIFSIACIIIGLLLHEKKPSDLYPLQRYIFLEFDILGLPEEDAIELVSNNRTITSLIASHEKYMLDVELNNNIPKDNHRGNCEELLTFDTEESNSYIKQYIKCRALYDNMLVLDKDSKQYWKDMYKISYELRHMESIKTINEYKCLYYYTKYIPILLGITMILILLHITLSVYNILVILESKRQKNNSNN